MLILNVTSKVAHRIEQEWKTWTREVWIPKMLATGLFGEFRFCKLRENDDEEGRMYVVQLHCDSEENYQTFLKEYDEMIRKEAYAQFGDAFIAFRTVMETLH